MTAAHVIVYHHAHAWSAFIRRLAQTPAHDHLLILTESGLSLGHIN